MLEWELEKSALCSAERPNSAGPIDWKVQDENGVLVQWLKELKDALHAAEDLFDELKYESLRYQVEATNDSSLASSSEKDITVIRMNKIAKNLNQLQLILREKLMENRFLLVLDNVWNEREKKRWDTLYAPMKYTKEGSQILITSRLETVVRMMGTSNPIKLEGLQEDDYWSFFKECAFWGVTVDDDELTSLQEIGKRIAKEAERFPFGSNDSGRPIER